MRPLRVRWSVSVQPMAWSSPSVGAAQNPACSYARRWCRTVVEDGAPHPSSSLEGLSVAARLRCRHDPAADWVSERTAIGCDLNEAARSVRVP